MKVFFTCCTLSFLLFYGCTKHLPRNFYNDPNNQGLSVLTSRSYNIMSTYINNIPYVNPYICTCGIFSQTWYNSPVSILLKETASPFDSLYISWQIADTDHTITPLRYNYLTLLMPVKKGFAERDFLSLNGQRFLQDTTNGIQVVLSESDGYARPGYNPYYNGQSLQNVVGPAGVYFTQIKLLGNDTASQYRFSGLFEGTPSDTLHITKGRFDFTVAASDLNF